MRHLATGSRFRHREERSDAAIQSRRLGPSSLNRFAWITAWITVTLYSPPNCPPFGLGDYADYGITGLRDYGDYGGLR